MKKLAALLSVVAMVAIAPLARADYEISFKVGAGAITSCLDNSDSSNSAGESCTQTASGVKIIAAGGSSNSPGTPGGADEFSSIATLQNTTGSAVTVTLWYLAQGFTEPATGPGVGGITFVSNGSGTGELGANSSTLNLTSCVDANGGGVGLSFCSSPYAALTNPALTIPKNLENSNTINEVFTPLGTPYSLEQQVMITLGAGDTINISTSQSLVPVPEPAAIVLLGTMLMVAGIVMRRRTAKQA